MKSQIETFSGSTFDPLRPNFADIRIEDIAHALANQCRFSGHTRFRYSVAEHSVRVSEWISPALLRDETWDGAQGSHDARCLWGLLHDASEAFLVDLPSPIKKARGSAIGVEYRAIERRLMVAVCKRFGLPIVEPEIVREADAVILATEVRDLMHGDRPYWAKLTHAPDAGRIRPWAPDVAEFEFLRRYRALTGDER